MKITYYGTSASEAWPALFCSCQACRMAKKLGGRNIRSRSQALIDTSLLIDFPPDTSYHVQHLDLNLQRVKTLLVTHSHHDHFFPYDIGMRMSGFAEGTEAYKLTIYGNEVIEDRLSEAARQFPGIWQFVEFRRAEPYQPFTAEDGYEIMPLLADHNQPEKSLIYIVKKKEKTLLYAHDTGIFPESSWEALRGRRFDFVSLDCTALSRDWRQGHMGFDAVDEVRARMEKMGCVDSKTILTLSYFAHFSDFTHEKICRTENPRGYEIAYDGCVFEF